MLDIEVLGLNVRHVIIGMYFLNLDSSQVDQILNKQKPDLNVS